MTRLCANADSRIFLFDSDVIKRKIIRHFLPLDLQIGVLFIRALVLKKPRIFLQFPLRLTHLKIMIVSILLLLNQHLLMKLIDSVFGRNIFQIFICETVTPIN